MKKMRKKITTLDSFISSEGKKEEKKERICEQYGIVPRDILDRKMKKLNEIAKKNREKNNADNLILLSVEYDSEKNKALMKFYSLETKEIYFLYDKTDHKPYFLTSADVEEIRAAAIKMRGSIEHIDKVNKFDSISDKWIELRRVVVSDPLAVGGKGGLRNLLGEDRSWEAWIPYHLNYIYDTKLWPSMFYMIRDGNPVMKTDEKNIDKDILGIFIDEEDYIELAKKYLPVLSADLPNIDFLALDIEVAGHGKIPQMNQPYDQIVAIGFTGYSFSKEKVVETREIFILGNYRNTAKHELGDIKIIDKNQYYSIGELEFNGKKINVRLYRDERLMLLDTFEKIWDIPILVTFNGDNFDLRYIYKRSEHLGISKELIPFKIVSKGEVKEAHMKVGIHIDLYKFFANAAIKTYAFGNKYETVSLEEISQALLGLGKLYLGLEEIEALKLDELAKYCWQDSYLTAQLFVFENQLPLKLLMVLSRITRFPIRELSRRGVSAWIENWFNAEHRERNYLIPNRYQLEKKEERVSKLGPRPPPIIIGKKYRGAIVLEPKPGVWFNVWVLDFASIYPTIIKVHNISYETVDCVHEDCRKNRVSETPHWVCAKRKGITSLLVGLIRDLRVKYFKKKAKQPSEKKEFYDIVQGALKVLINASYGVFGAEHFPLYSLSVAETITALGRQKIKAVVKKAQNLHLEVLYGDTDSIFIHNPDKKKIEELIKWAESEVKVDLEVDKIYKYLALSARKKNYFGVLTDGSVDIKGLMAKKRNTPEFLKKEFNNVLKILSEVKTEKDLKEAKKKIENQIIEIIRKLKKGAYSLQDLAFKVQLTKPLSEYTKTTPQHVQAARKLKREVRAGEIIAYVKTRDGVMPIEAKPKLSEIDWNKYIEFTKSVFDQLLDALGMSVSEIESKAKGVKDLSSFWS